jgi:hypothetical protein
MVARINKGHSLSRSLNYNELKLKQEKAELILAENYPKDMELLTFYDKLHRLTHQAELNERVKANSVHLSLNFDPKEKLNREKLQEIAQSYMEKIGFGRQPYLVYRHLDAGHPHVHILTTNIEADGKRIEMHNIGKNQSEKARKEVEKEFNLISPESKRLQQKLGLNQSSEYQLKPVHVQKVQYGKSETKRAIQNVVEHVMNNYKYTSLPEYNAVLKLYNVLADRGEKESLMYKNNGLTYRVLDEKGNKIGSPIKASEFYNKPTLKNLELKFSQNEGLRLQHAQRLRVQIDWAILQEKSLHNLSDQLKKEGISVIARQNPEGRIYGMTYVDHTTKCVFNGSDLGRQYCAKAILERCEVKENILRQEMKQKYSHIPSQNEPTQQKEHQKEREKELKQELSQERGRITLLDELLRVERDYETLPWQLRQKKRLRLKQKPSW